MAGPSPCSSPGPGALIPPASPLSSSRFPPPSPSRLGSSQGHPAALCPGTFSRARGAKGSCLWVRGPGPRGHIIPGVPARPEERPGTPDTVCPPPGGQVLRGVGRAGGRLRSGPREWGWGGCPLSLSSKLL